MIPLHLQSEKGQIPLSAAEMEAILSADTRGFSVVSHDGIFRFVSRRFCELFHCDRETLIGCPMETVITELQRHGLQSAGPETYEMVLNRTDGTNFPAKITVLALEKNHGEPGTLLYLQDRSEEKHVEDILRKTERLASAGRMAAAVAHEINNPLEAVMNLLFLLRNETATPEADRLLSLAASEVERVSRIARQSLAFFRESGQATRIDIRELLNMAASVHAVRTPNLRVHRRYRTSATVYGYASELQQVFHNLIGNAIEAGAKDIYLHVSHAVEAVPPGRAGIAVTIGDNGSGIDPRLRSQIFNPFFTTKGERGTGLGLWTSRGIVVRHEGTIQIRSSIAEGHSGTCFRIFLPC